MELLVWEEIKFFFSLFSREIQSTACQRSAGRLSRHAALNDIIRRSHVTVNVPAILEPAGIARDDGKRPDGMSLIPWRMGRVLVWDATCVNTLAPSHLHGTTKKAGAAAEVNKRRKYGGLDANYNFAPFGVETLGRWGPGAQSFFNDLAKRLVDITGDKRAGSLHKRCDSARKCCQYLWHYAPGALFRYRFLVFN